MTKFSVSGAAASLHREAPVTGGTWRVPAETPVAFVYNRRNYAVMLATPADMEDFAVGFSLTERVADGVEDILAADIQQSDQGIELHLSIAAKMLERFDIRQRRRNLAGRAGCGLCGLENAETFFERLPRVADRQIDIPQDALIRAMGEIGALQPLNQLTRTVHAAAWVQVDGSISLVREDVGRHNALDKVIGALARRDADLTAGFILMTSRCSYEIVEKCARVGIQSVASLSGPTAFAIAKAREAGMALYCRTGEAFICATPA